MQNEDSLFTFITATQSDKGVHSRQPDAIPRIRSHIARHTHSLRRGQREALLSRWESLGSMSLELSANGRLFLCHHDRLPDPRQIPSSLDPFVKLPLEISPWEKDLVHFCLSTSSTPRCSRIFTNGDFPDLSHGRRLSLGTSASPAYCPGLDVAERLLQKSPLYVLVHIVMSESIIAQLSGLPRRNHFYLRRAQAYQTMNAMLADSSVSFDAKLFGLIQLSMMESSTGDSSLQAVHIQAMDEFIESKGGLYAFWQQSSPEIVAIAPNYYVGQFCRVEVLISNRALLENSRDRFITSLRRIKTWTMALKESLPLTKAGPATSLASGDQSEKTHDIQPLQNYLHWISESVNESQSYAHPKPASALFCTFGFCITLVEYTHDAVSALELLKHAQNYMQRSTTFADDEKLELYTLSPIAAAHILSHVRSKECQNVADTSVKEFAICQAAVDAQKMLPLISWQGRGVLISNLVRCALVPVEDEARDCFDHQYLHDLQHHITASWLARTSSP